MKSYLFIIGVGCLLFSCQPKGMDARTYLEKARSLYENAGYDSAQTVLDSLKVLYPKDYAVLTEALHLSRLVELEQQIRTVALCDSLLQIRQMQRDSLKTHFIFEKNPEYDDVGKYYQPSQQLENNLQRSYIRSGVNESGVMELASVYYGNQPIRHTGLTVSNSKGEYTETVVIPSDGGMNYSFTDLNKTTEVVTYTGGKDNGVVLFIYNNITLPLKADYTGGKKYSLTVSPSDKAAVVQTFDFSVVLSDIGKLQKEKEKSSKRIAYLKEKTR